MEDFSNDTDEKKSCSLMIWNPHNNDFKASDRADHLALKSCFTNKKNYILRTQRRSKKDPNDVQQQKKKIIQVFPQAKSFFVALSCTFSNPLKRVRKTRNKFSIRIHFFNSFMKTVVLFPHVASIVISLTATVVRINVIVSWES